jgi:hydrogenase maturation protease
VLGLGNVLVGDDAFGPHVIALIRARFAAPAGVVIHDVGTPGLDLAPHIAGTRAVVVIDTVKADAPPGTLRLYRRHHLFARAPLPRTNPHQPGLVETLMLLDLLDVAPPDVLLIGAVPARYDTGARLSDPLAAAVHDAIDEVLHELERLGAPLTPRPEPGVPELWWEQTAAVPIRLQTS